MSKMSTPFARAVARERFPLAYNNFGHPVQRLHIMATRLEGMFALPLVKF